MPDSIVRPLSAVRRAPTLRALVVSDDARLRETLARALGRRSFEVLALSSGSARSDLARPAAGEGSSVLAELDVLLLDVAAGTVAAAVETLRRVRAPAPALPRACLVGATDADGLVRAAADPSLEVMIKPIDLAELGAVLERLCQGPKDAA